MAFFKLNWLKRLVRRHSTPIPYKKANRWRNRMSVGYLIVCWNLFGFIVYTAYKGGFDKEKLGFEKDPFDDLSPSERFAVRGGVRQAKIVRPGEGVLLYKKENYQEFIDRFDRNKKKDNKDDYKDPDNLYENSDTDNQNTETQ